jgi:hypothetical protein
MCLRQDDDESDVGDLRAKFIREAEQDIEGGLGEVREAVFWPRHPVSIHVRRRLLAALFAGASDDPARSQIARRA